MILCRDFVFVHMRKTGGSFVRTILRRFAPAEWELQELPYHVIASEVPASHAHLPKAGCIRNPFAWYVSWYHYYLRRVRDGSIDPSHHFWDYSLGGSLDFAPTLWRLFELEVNQRGAAVGPYMMHLEEMYGPSCSLVQLVRTERVGVELAEFLAQHTHVPASLAEALAERPPVNVSKHAHYSTYYDDELRDRVLEVEAAVFQYLGYVFESPDGERG